MRNAFCSLIRGSESNPGFCFPFTQRGSKLFKDAHGSVNPWHIRISLHVDASLNKHDKRPFAHVYVVWQDKSHDFHMFRERWIKDSGRWYSRVVGLVPNP